MEFPCPPHCALIPKPSVFSGPTHYMPNLPLVWHGHVSEKAACGQPPWRVKGSGEIILLINMTGILIKWFCTQTHTAVTPNADKFRDQDDASIC